MASPQSIANLKSTVDALQAINRERLLRETLGEASLAQSSFGATFDEILRKGRFAVEYAPGVDDGTSNNARGIFEQVKGALEQQVNRNSTEYVSQRDAVINNCENLHRQLLTYWPPFVTAAIEARNFLADEGIRREYEKTVNNMKAQADETLEHLKTEAEKAIQGAKELADQIEQRARRTATKISVKDARDQFEKAQQDLRKQARMWAGLSLLAIVSFFVVAVYLVKIELPDKWTWQVLYYTAIRVTILSAVGAVASFCLRLLRAHIHLSHKNLHRQRVANSMAAFVESAVTPEQRDLILAQLVSAVVEFGNSGLVEVDEGLQPQRMTIDSITRSLIPPVPKQ